MMRILNISDIRAFDPPYDPIMYLPENWRGTVLDLLDLSGPSTHDKIWASSRFLTDKTNRLFAVSCAREVLAFIGNPDPRSVAVCGVAEKFAHGHAGPHDLAEARDQSLTAWALQRATAASDRGKALGIAWTAAWVAASDAGLAAWAAAVAARAVGANGETQIECLKTLILGEEPS